MAPESQKPNGMVQALAQLAQSGHAWIQFGTLALIGLSGIGNWVATWNSANQNKEQIEINRRISWEGEQRIREDVRRQVAEIHDWIRESKDDFDRGNADSAANKRTLNELENKVDRLLKKP